MQPNERTAAEVTFLPGTYTISGQPWSIPADLRVKGHVGNPPIDPRTQEA